MSDELVSQIVLQAPTVAALLYLLFRLDNRLDELIKTICELATDRDDDRATESPRKLG